MTARERIQHLLDEDRYFFEIGAFIVHANLVTASSKVGRLATIDN